MRTIRAKMADWLGAACAAAAEGGQSFSLLGSGGPEAAVSPPVQGVFVDNLFYVYDGSAAAGKQFEVGGAASLSPTNIKRFGRGG